MVVGALFGISDAAISLHQMKTIRFESILPSVLYRLLIGGALYSQIFLATWLGSFLPKIFLGLKIQKAHNAHVVTWALVSSVITAFCLPLLVRLNQLLPSIRSPESLMTNAAVAIGAVAFLIITGMWLSKFNWKFKKLYAVSLPAIIFLEVLFVITLATLSNEPSISSAAHKKPDLKNPNIILITIDTLRADHLSSYGYKGIKTPAMDRLAEKGVVFENAISTTSWTLPTFATLFTGVHQEVHGLNRHDVRLAPAFETVPESLQKAGYYTAAVVTNEFLNHPYNLDQGFDTYVFSSDAAAYHPLSGLMIYDFIFARKNERHNAENMTTRAISLLEKVNQRPFFFWIHYIDPHTPYGAWYLDRFPNYDKNYAGDLGTEINDLDGRPFSEEDKRHILAMYDAEIMYTDSQIDRLLRAIDKLNLRNNTAVILTSDHGEEFWDHGDVLHGRTLYRESIHVPLIIRYPEKIPEKKKVKPLATLLDLAPTILDFAGITAPTVYQGSSLLRYFNRDVLPKAFVSLDKLTPDKKRYDSLGVYDASHAYLKWNHPARGEELFDMQTDFFQKNDVFGDFENLAKMYRHSLAEQVGQCAVIKGQMGLKEEGSRIELTPGMRDALRGLGYIN